MHFSYNSAHAFNFIGYSTNDVSNEEDRLPTSITTQLILAGQSLNPELIRLNNLIAYFSIIRTSHCLLLTK